LVSFLWRSKEKKLAKRRNKILKVKVEVKAGLLALLALRANLRLFKAHCALVPLREDDSSEISR